MIVTVAIGRSMDRVDPNFWQTLVDPIVGTSNYFEQHLFSLIFLDFLISPQHPDPWNGNLPSSGVHLAAFAHHASCQLIFYFPRFFHQTEFYWIPTSNEKIPTSNFQPKDVLELTPAYTGNVLFSVDKKEIKNHHAGQVHPQIMHDETSLFQTTQCWAPSLCQISMHANQNQRPCRFTCHSQVPNPFLETKTPGTSWYKFEEKIHSNHDGKSTWNFLKHIHYHSYHLHYCFAARRTV